MPVDNVRTRNAAPLAAVLAAVCGAAAALAACGAAPAPVAVGAPPLASAVPVEAIAAATGVPATATLAPEPSIPPSPSITPTPLHPLMIEAMRQQEYPGSQLVFEQILEPGANYDRFIVSYLSEGNKIYALLTVPRGEKPATGWPVVIFNHGFIPPEQYRTTERYVAYVDAFARHEYIVLRSDYRGHGSSEGIASGGYGSPAYTVDVLNAVASIQQNPDADPNRIGMWGHSMGGQITLRAMVVSDDIKAGVIWAGVVGSYPDLFEHWWNRRNDGPTPTPNPTSTRGRWRSQLTEVYGTPEENPTFWASISPNSYLSEISGPIQLHHGTADSSVPLVLSELLAGELQAAGIPGELYIYDGDDHNLSASFSTAMQRSIQWFDTYVKGG